MNMIDGMRILSLEGFSIEPLGREGMRFSEGDRSLYVFREYLKATEIGIGSNLSRPAVTPTQLMEFSPQCRRSC